MHVRCATCDAELPAGTDAIGPMCDPCRRHRALLQAHKLGANREERARRARDYAAEHKIDLASAYMFLLGFKEPDTNAPPLRRVTLDADTPKPVDIAAIETAAGPNVEHGTPLPDVPVSISPTHRYDPEFGPAVEEGFLTPREASERGNRAAYVAELAKLYHVEMDLAYMLADNRITLDSAGNGEDHAAEWTFPVRSNDAYGHDRSRAAHVAVVGGAVCVGVLCTVLSCIELTRDSGKPKAHAPASAISGKNPGGPGDADAGANMSQTTLDKVTILADRSGALTQVSGPNPISVLEAFCNHASNRSRFRLEAIVPGDVPKVSERIGVLVDRRRNVRVALIVSMEARTQRWQIGNGKSPVAFLDKPPQIVGSLPPPTRSAR